MNERHFFVGSWLALTAVMTVDWGGQYLGELDFPNPFTWIWWGMFTIVLFAEILNYFSDEEEDTDDV